MGWIHNFQDNVSSLDFLRSVFSALVSISLKLTTNKKYIKM